MKCYECAREGKDTDAVGICIVCGRGVCKEHLRGKATILSNLSLTRNTLKGSSVSPAMKL
jgi:hypothetical protein